MTIPTTQQGPLAHINIFTPKPGMMDEFVTVQLQGLASLGDIPGSRGSQMFRANDNRHAILIALFVDEASHRRFMASPAFIQHRARLQPLLEGTAPGYYTLVYARDSASAANLPASVEPTAG